MDPERCSAIPLLGWVAYAVAIGFVVVGPKLATAVLVYRRARLLRWMRTADAVRREQPDLFLTLSTPELIAHIDRRDKESH